MDLKLYIVVLYISLQVYHKERLYIDMTHCLSYGILMSSSNNSYMWQFNIMEFLHQKFELMEAQEKNWRAASTDKFYSFDYKIE